MPCGRSFLILKRTRGFTTFGDHARIEASMAQELWTIEERIIANGICQGFEGDRLMEYAEKRLRQCEVREERRARRQEGALRTEFNGKLKKMNDRTASSTYEEAKRDLLASLGRTPDKEWKTLLTEKQRSEEYLKPVEVEAQDVEAQGVEAKEMRRAILVSVAGRSLSRRQMHTGLSEHTVTGN